MVDDVPVCLTIGSSDSCGGAGIQGDIKAFASVGCYAATVVVGITAQNTHGVLARSAVPPALVVEQMAAVLDELPIAAVKMGSTWSVELLEALAPSLAALAARGVPVVVDPVMVTAAGDSLTGTGAITRAVFEHLVPSAVVVTPNRTEAALLAGDAQQHHSREDLADQIVRLGAPAVVITPGSRESGDWFFDGTTHRLLPGPRHANRAEHGAGCAHSAVLAGLLGQGWPLCNAVDEAHQRASEGVRSGLVHIGTGMHPVDLLQLRARACGKPAGTRTPQPSQT